MWCFKYVASPPVTRLPPLDFPSVSTAVFLQAVLIARWCKKVIIG